MLQLDGLVAMPWSMNDALGRGVPREPRRRSIGVAGGSPNGRAVGEGRGVGRASCGGGRQSCTWSTSWLVRSGGSGCGPSSRRCCVGVAWALWGVRVELAWLLALVGARSGCSPASLGDVAGGRGRRAWSSAACWRRGRLARFAAAAAARDAGAAGVGAGDDRRGRRGGSVPVPGRVVGRARAGRRSCCACACGAGSRSPSSTRAASSWRRACARARFVCCAIRGTRRGRACCSCGAIRSRTRRRCAWPAADAEALSLWEPIPVGVDEQGEPVAIELVERNVLIGGEPGAGKSAALSMLIAAGGARSRRADLAAGRQARRAGGVGAGRASGSPARTARRRSRCCARCARRWTRAIASCSRAGCARSAARTGCRCTWWSATSWRSI